jgi:hypothetical protein
MILLAVGLMAQTTTTNGSAKRLSGSNYFTWNVSVDSTEVEYSQPFTFAGFEPSTLKVYYSADLDSAVTNGKGYSTVVSVLASYDGTNWIAVDTLATLTAATITSGNNDLGTIVAPYYKLKAHNTKANNALKVGVYMVP